MKSSYLIIFLLLISISVDAQLTKKRADKYLEEYSFAKAIELYQAHLIKATSDKDAMLKLAECYVRINDPEGAVKWYSQSIDQDSIENYHYLNYANMLSEEEKYAESKKWYEKYKNAVGEDGRSDNHISGIDGIDKYFLDSTRYSVVEFPYNSTEIDFSPTFYGDGIVFSSARVNGDVKMVQHNFTWNMKAYLDLYTYTKGDTMARPFGGPVNSPYHEGAATFNAAESKIYFTRNNFQDGKKGKSSKGINKIKIYSANKGVEGWGAIKEFQYDNAEYSMGEPFYYEPENVMFFASDMPGGFGGLDLYRTTWADSAWSVPVNLGPQINTEGQDRSPFYMEDGTLIFASDGWGGLGGLDNYSAKISLQAAGGETVKNWGYPINTSKDDFGLILNIKNQTGYFASNRSGGTGQDDIYQLEIVGVPDVVVSGIVYLRREDQSEADRKPIYQSIVEVIRKSDGEKITDLVTKEDGSFSIALPPEESYQFVAKKDTFIESKTSVKLVEGGKADDLSMTLVQRLAKPTKVILKSKILDLENNEGLADVGLYLLNEETDQIQYVKTDENGEYVVNLEPNSSYVLKGTKAEYLTDCARFKTPAASRDGQDFDKPFSLEKISLERVFKIENVYFDVNKSDIRPDAAIELNKVVEFLKENPTIEAELGSHTDSRGSDAYNLSLSDRRAKSSSEYIVSQGIESSRIVGKGYGESTLTNRCSNGVKCSKAEHQANRRTELRITGISKATPEVAEGSDKGAGGINPEADHSDCVELRIVKK